MHPEPAQHPRERPGRRRRKPPHRSRQAAAQPKRPRVRAGKARHRKAPAALRQRDPRVQGDPSRPPPRVQLASLRQPKVRPGRLQPRRELRQSRRHALLHSERKVSALRERELATRHGLALLVYQCPHPHHRRPARNCRPAVGQASPHPWVTLASPW